MARRLNNAARRDPTQTTGIRAQFVKDMRGRLSQLQKDIETSIVTRDCFGLQISNTLLNTATQVREFAFERSEQKVSLFMKWLKDQEKKGILKVEQRANGRGTEPWSNSYIRSGYSKGIDRARREMVKAGVPVPPLSSIPGGPNFAMGTTIHADKVGAIYTRTFEDLQTVMDVTNARVRRQLTDGLTTQLSQGISEGKSPRDIARSIMKNVNGAVEHVGKARATLIARTEVIRAHTVATVNEYRQIAGDIDVDVMAEVLTTPDDALCPICEDLAASGPYSLAKAETLIPAHPNCRCGLIPHVTGIAGLDSRSEAA